MCKECAESALCRVRSVEEEAVAKEEAAAEESAPAEEEAEAAP